ncbi:hypothetical protein AVEN_268624-1, partial [Araneus ventricosus]
VQDVLVLVALLRGGRVLRLAVVVGGATSGRGFLAVATADRRNAQFDRKMGAGRQS